MRIILVIWFAFFLVSCNSTAKKDPNKAMDDTARMDHSTTNSSAIAIQPVIIPVSDIPVSIKVKGKPVDLTKKYTFVACEREGDPDTTICRVGGVTEPTRLGSTLHNVIQEYLAKASPIAPKLEGRATATDAPNTLLTQLMGVGYEFR